MAAKCELVALEPAARQREVTPSASRRRTRLGTGASAALLWLALAVPGCAAARAAAPAVIEFARDTVATSDFGDARLQGTANRLALRSSAESATHFRWGLDYAYQRYEYQGLASRNRDLHRLAVPLGWQVDGPLPWSVELRPVIATSSNVFKDFLSRGSADDFMWHGRAAIERPPRGREWGWRLGVARDDGFGREAVYPVAALLRRYGGMFMELGWPVTRAMLQAGRGVELGGEIAPAGGRWHVVSDERDGARFDYEVRAWRAGAIARWRADRGFLLAARAGLEFDRRHRLEDDTGATVQRAVGEAMYVTVSAGYQW